MEFKDLIAYQQAFERYLEKQQLVQGYPSSLYEPIGYIMALGGKRIRPVLTLLAHKLFDHQYARALPQAMAVETFHNFSLMHDDIMDQATTRRGGPSVHHQFGINAAILSGDAMLIMAYQYLVRDLTQDQLISALSLFSSTALDICRGQQQDMDFEKKDLVSIEDYLAMIRNKTAVLLGLSMSLGAIVGGADAGSVVAMKQCGESAGMAFQIHDDYLDAFGQTNKTGKKRGGDIIQNKKTFLWLMACNLGGERIREELISISHNQNYNSEAKVNRVLEVYRSLDIESQCQNRQRQYTDEAINALNQVNAPDSAKQQIFDLMALLLARNH
ncbi:MAG: polyprenyl synthetase family protein [Saprospiraceae bacterium]|nr:polyprenyl synthetase family protein [Saprospiraceae bacterium]